MPHAEPAQRATGHATLSVGLVPIALNIYSGTDSKAGVERHEYLPVPVLENGQPVIKTVTKEDGSTEEVQVFENIPVGRGYTNKNTGELLTPTEKAQVQSKVETDYGPVYVEDHEVETLFTLKPDTMKVLSFQPQVLFHQGHYVPTKLMYVEPMKYKTGKLKGQYDEGGLKLYATLMEALRREGKMAVVELTTRGKPKPCVLMPDGRLWQVWHTDEIREQREIPEYETNPAEVAMMQTLIQQQSSTEPVDLSDERAALINEFATNKAKAGDFGKPEEVSVQAAEPPASVDLMALLSASVEAAKESREEEAV